MFSSIKQRLELLFQTQHDIISGKIIFDAEKKNFGFRLMEQLFPVSIDEIKGYPCVVYNKYSDSIKFGVKIIPLELKYDKDSHPCHIEHLLLQEFTNLVVNYESPHITFFFKEMPVNNKKKALTRFPLKSLRHDIFKESNILIAEFVPGGSIEEWFQEQPNISEKQWKYIVFSMAWTLLVLHEKYKFMHNDFHYGNILVDTSIDPLDKGLYQYNLVDENENTNINFNVINKGILPKMWDFEFANVYEKISGKEHCVKNEFFKSTDETIPHEFNPYYDLHCFLTSLLELNIPEKLENFIRSIYPDEVLPEQPEYDSQDYGSKESKKSRKTSSFSRNSSKNSSRKSLESSNDSCTSSCESSCKKSRKHSSSTSSSYTSDSSYTDEYVEEFYETDESSHDSSKNSDSDSDTYSNSSSESFRSDGSKIRTEYMLGDRMLNGTEKIFKLPKPIDILKSSYFADYRKSKTKEPTCIFKFKVEKKDKTVESEKFPLNEQAQV